MPRQARLDMPGALHHIMVRGLNKTTIFVDDQDRGKFLERLGEGIVAAEIARNVGVVASSVTRAIAKLEE